MNLKSMICMIIDSDLYSIYYFYFHSDLILNSLFFLCVCVVEKAESINAMETETENQNQELIQGLNGMYK